MVAIWRRAMEEAAPPASLRGLVQHIASGEQRRFAEGTQLLHILRAGATPATCESDQ